MTATARVSQACNNLLPANTRAASILHLPLLGLNSHSTIVCACDDAAARSFGPSVVYGDWTHHWIFWVGPFTGAIAAFLVYEFTFRPSQEPVSFSLPCTVHASRACNVCLLVLNCLGVLIVFFMKKPTCWLPQHLGSLYAFQLPTQSCWCLSAAHTVLLVPFSCPHSVAGAKVCCRRVVGGFYMSCGAVADFSCSASLSQLLSDCELCCQCVACRP